VANTNDGSVEDYVIDDEESETSRAGSGQCRNRRKTLENKKRKRKRAIKRKRKRNGIGIPRNRVEETMGRMTSLRQPLCATFNLGDLGGTISELRSCDRKWGRELHIELPQEGPGGKGASETALARRFQSVPGIGATKRIMHRESTQGARERRIPSRVHCFRQ
jgi:glyoxylate carboligase